MALCFCGATFYSSIAIWGACAATGSGPRLTKEDDRVFEDDQGTLDEFLI